MNTPRVSRTKALPFGCEPPLVWWGVIVLVLISLSLPSLSRAETYYWNPATGSDTNNGCCATGTAPNGPWKTLKKVRDAGLSGGNTVNIVVGNYTRSQYQAVANDYPVWTQAHSKGAAGAPLIIQSDPASAPAKARFDGERDGEWVSFSPTATVDYYILIRNIEFQHYTAGVINIGNGSITSCPASAIARHVAVMGNYVHDNYQGGAAWTGTLAAENVIFQDNTTVHTGDPTFGFPGAGDHAYYLTYCSKHVVIDRNYTEQVAGFAHHLYGGWVTGSFIQNIILRRNTTVNANHGHTIMCCSNLSNLYVYNNTHYGEAHSYAAIEATTGIVSTTGMVSFHNGQNSLTNTHVKNNLSSGYTDTASGLLWSDSGLAPTNPFEMDYNWWGYVGGGGAAYLWLGTAYTSNAAFQAATIYGDHDKEGNPLFINPASGTRNFALQTTSPARNAGTTLTTAVGAGTSSTSLTVADAGYFHDGYGFGAEIPGDTIQVGSVTTTITSINYSTNVLTVSPAITWVNGAGVSLPYNGSAPDMGALESAEVATQLSFSTPPTLSYAGVTMTPVTVQALTATGTLDTTFAGTITLTLTVVSGSGTLTGTVSKAAVGGQATFSDLVVSAIGTYSLHAASGTLTAADSANFTVLAASASVTSGVDLDGVDDSLTVGTSTAYHCTNATCTVMGWFRNTGNDRYIVAKRSLANGQYFLRVATSGVLLSRLYDGGGGPVLERSTVSTTNKDGQWHCFALVFTTSTSSHAGNALTLYVDGVLDQAAVVDGSGVYGTFTVPLMFGALSDLDPSGFLTGGVDDLRFYTAGLSAENIARYCSAKVKFGGFTWGNLLSYWPLNQCAEGASGDAVAFNDVNKGGSAAVGNDGANNTGVTCHGTNRMSYPASVD